MKVTEIVNGLPRLNPPFPREALEEQGFEVRKVAMDLDEWARWCRERGLPLNGKSRSRYAAVMAERG